MNKIMKNHYFKTKLVKMGKWAILPLDSETWHTLDTSTYHRKYFGIGKGTLTIQTPKDLYQHEYIPVEYLNRLYRRIDEISKKDIRAIGKILKKFYPLNFKSQTLVSKYANQNFCKYSNNKLVDAFKEIKDRVHEVVVFDQFTWLAEEYWTPKIQYVLTKELKLKLGSKEYNRVQFILTKPENISTTVLEKIAVISSALKIKKKKSSILKESVALSKKFGWLPVFVYGEVWGPEHYQKELSGLFKKSKWILEKELDRLNQYSRERNTDIIQVIKKYGINKKDLQLFIDFSLAVGVRNEAEYFVGYAGQFLVPLYKEIAKRLYLSVDQLRMLFEKEIVAALKKEIDITKILDKKKGFIGFGFNKNISKRIDFSPEETKSLFEFLEKKIKNIQENSSGKGLCASPGKAKGKVRIVPRPEDNNKVKEGDIMITYSTTTDYLPAMKRAGAIVTEVGGQTCHAAVVSREFGIPCLVAVTDAMKKYKDGDVVEVDAERGFVRKISR